MEKIKRYPSIASLARDAKATGGMYEQDGSAAWFDGESAEE